MHMKSFDLSLKEKLAEEPQSCAHEDIFVSERMEAQKAVRLTLFSGPRHQKSTQKL